MAKADLWLCQQAVDAKAKHGGIRPGARALGITPSTMQNRLEQALAAGLSPKVEAAAKPPKPIAGGTLVPPEAAEVRRKGDRFVVTCAQNNTYVHKGFLASLQWYCAAHRAELLVAPFTYNKNAWESAAGKIVAGAEGLWYDPAVLPFICTEPTRLAPDLIFCADVDTLPTRKDPLSDRDDYTKQSSGIFPHIKVRMKSVATMKGDPAKFLYTTGTCTQRNYIPRSAGKVASFHHTFAALVVEVEPDGTWFVRQLIADDTGAFQDMEHRYSPAGIEASHVEGVTWFDIHAEKADQRLLGVCFDGPDSVLDTLKPRHQFIHDLTDFQARNHHNIKNPHFRAKMKARGCTSVEGNMRESAAFLKRVDRGWCKTVVVESNHDQAFLRWLSEADGHQDDENNEYWHTWNAAVLREIRLRNDRYLVFEAAVRQHADLGDVTFLREDDSYVICPEHGGGIECGAHGHRGANGAKGSPRSYRGMGRRVNRGDQHSAGIEDGVYTSGASNMDMEYNKGMSSWSESFTLTYPNGKRTIVTVRGKKWRAAA